MQEWFQQMVGPEYASAVMWTVLALVLLFVLILLMRLARGMNAGTFVLGGRNRKTRLAVMDATAVDANRRLVLVRRDHVEHLLLIGGPTDLVVEQNIGQAAPIRRGETQREDAPPVQMAEASRPEPAPQIVNRPASPAPQPPRPVAPPPPPVAQPREIPQPTREAPQRREVGPTPDLDFAPAPAPSAPPRPVAPPPAAAPAVRIEPNIAPASSAPAFAANQADAEPQLVSAYKVQRGTHSDSGWLLQHDEPAQAPGHSDRPDARAPQTKAADIDEQSLEEEMNRLLDDLSPPRRS